MRCKHCGDNIVQYNAYNGPRWTHRHLNASFLDGAHDVCYGRTVAEPVAPADPTTNRGEHR